MFCSNCGKKQQNDEARFCYNCGSQLASLQQESILTVEVEEDEEEEEPEQLMELKVDVNVLRAAIRNSDIKILEDALLKDLAGSYGGRVIFADLPPGVIKEITEMYDTRTEAEIDEIIRHSLFMHSASMHKGLKRFIDLMKQE